MSTPDSPTMRLIKKATSELLRAQYAHERADRMNQAHYTEEALAELLNGQKAITNAIAEILDILEMQEDAR